MPFDSAVFCILLRACGTRTCFHNGVSKAKFSRDCPNEGFVVDDAVSYSCVEEDSRLDGDGAKATVGGHNVKRSERSNLMLAVSLV